MSPSSLPAHIRQSAVGRIPGIFVSDLAVLFRQEGLLGAPVRRCRQGYWYFNPSQHYALSLTGPYTSRALWRPSFLPSELWDQAVLRFVRGDLLRTCLSRSLLPILDRPDALFRYLYYDRPLACSFVDRGILETPIHITEQHLYFFDGDGIYARRPRPPSGAELQLWHESYQNDLDQRSWLTAVRQCFRPGMTLEACLDTFLAVQCEPEPAVPATYFDIERFVQRISRPSFEREPENQNRRTFDRIRIQVDLPVYRYPTFSSLAAAVRKHKHAIDQMVLDRLDADHAFHRYGVPLNFLKLTECTLRRDHALEYLFELKL